jgi:LAGLIDADG DNA endonuclease family
LSAELCSLFNHFVLFSSTAKSNGKNNKTKRLTNTEKKKFQLTPFLREVLIGMVLSDAHMRKSSHLPNSFCNARVRFLQNLNQADFIYHSPLPFGQGLDLFKLYCSSSPKISSSIIKETGNIRKNISFITRCLPCFNEI